MLTMVTRKGKISSYKSYVKNISMKINLDNIGTTFQHKEVIYKKDKEGKKVFDRIKITPFKNTEKTVKEELKQMNKLQGDTSRKKVSTNSTSNKAVREYMKSKNWKKVKITSNSNKKQIRTALKNQKIYLEAQARGAVAYYKSRGIKLTLKDARQNLADRKQEYEGVGGSW